MTPKEIEKAEEATAWLRACSLYLANVSELRLNQRSCAELSRTFARVARLLGDRAARPVAGASGSDFIAFAASGGPPPIAHAVPLPEAGANVVALIPAAARRPLLTPKESDHA